jgi:hypothetical protein
MNSSISSSDAPGWKRFAATLVGGAALILVSVVAFAFAVDPYDTGRSNLIGKPGLRPQGPWSAAASRGRDQSFDAAITGNSHIQLLSPERLKAATGLDFVQLSTPGSWPREQFAVLNWFLRQRQKPARAVVVSADQTWCGSDPAAAATNPFPMWLYSESTWEYLRGLLRYGTLEEAGLRVAYWLDPKAERASPDGYWDYDPRLARTQARNPELRRQLEARPYANAQRLEQDPAAGTREFPAAHRLREVAARLPAETALIVVFPPRYTLSQPPPETEAGYLDAACKASIAEAARIHGRSAIIDWRVQRPENQDPALFVDAGHYRQPLARLIEADIAKALTALK